jgi:hypothetical protein
MNRNTRLILALCTLTALSLVCSPSNAASPTLTRIEPQGIQRGTERELTITGARLGDAEDLMFGTPGLTLKEFTTIEDSKLVGIVSASGDVQPGLHYFRIRTRTGISPMRPFFVGNYPEVAEVEPNNSIDTPQPIELGYTVEGVVETEDIDFFQVSLAEGQRLSVEVEGMRLGNTMFDPYLALYDEEHNELIVSDDTPLLRQDPFITFVAPKAGNYVIELRDASFEGNASALYRMHVGSFPRPAIAVPAGGQAGQTEIITFLNPDGSSFQQEVTFPADIDGEFNYHPHADGERPATGNPMTVRPYGNVVEVTPNNSREEATPIPSLPIAINGVISTPDEHDYFKVELKKDQTFFINVLARVIGSPLDSVVTVFGPDGQTVGNNDDRAQRELDSALEFTAPADGTHYIRIRDSLGDGGPHFAYRAEIDVPRPRLALSNPQFAQNDSHYRQFIPVPRGGSFAMTVNVARNGVNDDIDVLVDKLPQGVTLSQNRISQGQNSASILFEASADAPLAGGFLPARARSAGETPVEGSLNQPFDFVTSGPGYTVHYSVPVDQFPVAVVERAPFALSLEQPKTALVRDGKMDLKVVATRDEGFTAPIKVFMLFRPPGVNILVERVIPEGQLETTFELNCETAAPTSTWQLIVLGEAENNGLTYNAAPPVNLIVEEPYINGTAELTAVPQGSSTEFVVKLEQLREFEGEAKATLIGMPNAVTSVEKSFGKDASEIVFPITTTSESPIGKHTQLFVEVEIPVGDGLTVNHQLVKGSTLRIDQPRPAELAKPAETPAPERRLSRLEQLRLDAENARGQGSSE